MPRKSRDSAVKSSFFQQFTAKLAVKITIIGAFTAASWQNCPVPQQQKRLPGGAYLASQPSVNLRVYAAFSILGLHYGLSYRLLISSNFSLVISASSGIPANFTI